MSYLKLSIISEKKNLISDEKLDELRKTARERAKIRNEENQKEIDRIYGKYRGGYIPSNNTKPDKTAEMAMRNAGKKGVTKDGAEKNVHNENS